MRATSGKLKETWSAFQSRLKTTLIWQVIYTIIILNIANNSRCQATFIWKNLISRLASDLVLLVLQKVLPRGYMRKYLMEIISFDEVAAIFRNWRDLQGENIMHLAVAQYDLDFVK